MKFSKLWSYNNKKNFFQGKKLIFEFNLILKIKNFLELTSFFLLLSFLRKF